MNDKNKISDHDIEEYLKRETTLSATYAQSKELKAPDHLEFSVKKLAREAENKSSKNNGWLVPLSIAATIVIAVTFSFFIDTQTTDKNTLLVELDSDTADKSSPLTEGAPVTKQQTASTNNEIVVEPETHPTQPLKSTLEEKPKASIAEKQPDQHGKQQSTQVTDETGNFELPPHLRDIVQTTSAGSSDKLLPAEILKTWTRKQWKEQIQMLQTSGKEILAKQYIEQYPAYYPGESLLTQ